jgi:hypothetical protein
MLPLMCYAKEGDYLQRMGNGIAFIAFLFDLNLHLYLDTFV